MRAAIHGLLVTLAVFAHFISAHKQPKTPEEIEVQRALQAAAYHCAPTVDQFTAARKRAWARQVLAGRPTLPGNQELFSTNVYGDESEDVLPSPEPTQDGQTLMGCTPVSTSKIQNNTCVLAPEVLEGPYYHEAGHPLRQNVAELQAGLLLLLDIGVIDVTTCKPLPNVLVDLWHTNATGHYSGHPGLTRPEREYSRSDQDSEGPIYPRTKPKETWLRGAWPTDENGVVQFTTIFPGYYQGRATHIHAKVLQEWTPLKNGTYRTRRVVHVGQFFFDDDINVEVDKMYPYTENPIAHTFGRTRNWRDAGNVFEDAWGPEGKYNPIFKMHLLGGIVNQGLIGYITMGVNASFSA
ncbi:hypothetical protein AN958_04410 [Leucoagaricus sp. SymC.cos]|nr:hypothetical protein AN958_04410 [Leucoagaricus sp. SymC.cos]